MKTLYSLDQVDCALKKNHSCVLRCIILSMRSTVPQIRSLYANIFRMKHVCDQSITRWWHDHFFDVLRLRYYKHGGCVGAQSRIMQRKRSEHFVAVDLCWWSEELRCQGIRRRDFHGDFICLALICIHGRGQTERMEGLNLLTGPESKEGEHHEPRERKENCALIGRTGQGELHECRKPICFPTLQTFTEAATVRATSSLC